MTTNPMVIYLCTYPDSSHLISSSCGISTGLKIFNLKLWNTSLSNQKTIPRVNTSPSTFLRMYLFSLTMLLLLMSFLQNLPTPTPPIFLNGDDNMSANSWMIKSTISNFKGRDLPRLFYCLRINNVLGLNAPAPGSAPDFTFIMQEFLEHSSC